MSRVFANVGVALLGAVLGALFLPLLLALLLVVSAVRLGGLAIEWLDLHAIFDGDRKAYERAKWKGQW